MQLEKVTKIKEDFLRELAEEKNSKERKKICKKYIEEDLSSVFSLIKNLSAEKKAEIGKAANELRELIFSVMKEEAVEKEAKRNLLDVTFPGEKPEVGSLHPLTTLQQKCAEIFSRMGFVVAEGPELENEWYNFDALNFKADHPVREMQDTLFVKQKDRNTLSSRDKYLMRTHTSPVQVRYMEKREPPFRIVAPGRVFRNEATDSSHEINFYQFEGLMVGEDVSVANFKAVIEHFLRELFGTTVDIRLRPSFFPFTEPSFEVDVSCSICEKKGCSVCQQTGWIELLGAGMVHPNVLKSAGVDPAKFKGFAFGCGIDRIAMIKHKIDDIRLFYSGDLRFLKQF
jgi:phenylalanyl-tRNA synthetase alpha chain